jgi:hypothetical protein
MQRQIGGDVFLRFGLFAIGLTLLTSTACRAKNAITHDELVSRTQERFENLAAGDQTPWKEYFAADSLYFDEKGRNMDKAALVADATPLPRGYSGTIKVVNAQSLIEENVAILSYDMNETETIFGQFLTARYHATDTWIRRGGQWQIVAGQVLRYYEDPVPGKIDSTKLFEYLGTYELASGNRLTILMEGKRLFRQRGDKPEQELVPEAGDIFFRKGVEGRILFRHNDNGRVDALIDRRNNEDVIWKKIE